MEKLFYKYNFQKLLFFQNIKNTTIVILLLYFSVYAKSSFSDILNLNKNKKVSESYIFSDNTFTLSW